MADQTVKDPKAKRSWDRPEGATFAQWMDARVARHSTRKYDWNALKFQADYDPKYRRAQMRYVGTGGTGVAADSNTIPAEHFTFSTMVLPAGAEGPLHIHNDVERRLRDLMQVQIRNTGLRYRFATIQQKFGSYNTYWRRTLRQIENGTYIRNLSKISRRAAQTGEEIPEEILAAMPKRMRDQVKRDRELALAAARRRDGTNDDGMGFDDEVATGPSAIAAAVDRRTRDGAHILSEDDGDLDLDAFFAAMTDEADAPADTRPQPGRGRADRASTVTEPDEFGADDHSAPPQRPSAPAPHVAATLGGPPPRRSSPSIPVATGVRTTGPVPVVKPPGGTGELPRADLSAIDPPTERGTGLADYGHTTRSIPTFPEQGGRTTRSIPTFPDPGRTSGPIPTQRPGTPPPVPRAPTNPGGTGSIPTARTTGPIPAQRPGTPPPTAAQSGPMPRQRPDTFTQDDDTNPDAFAFAVAGKTPAPAPRPGMAPSQVTKPIPVAPGASQKRPSTPVESMSGPFPRAAPPPVSPRQPAPQAASRPPTAAPMRPPPGMNDADVNALYAKYVQAKKAVGEDAGPGAYGKLMATITAQAPKIMEQYKAKGVEFSVVVKDNQVVIKAKPKP